MARVMIVDDAIVVRERLKTILVRAGHEIVAEAGNGHQAATLYGRVKPDLVTMDLTMPEMGGIEAVRRIRAQDKNATIVVITALGQKSVVLDALDAGASGFILKPIDKDRVLATIDSLKERWGEISTPEDSDREKEAEAIRTRNHNMNHTLDTIRK